VTTLRRRFIASISGKGGVGKTTLTALLLKILIEYSSEDSILVVDADPAMNLPEVLGVEVPRTIGDVVEEFRRKISSTDILGFEKSSLLQYWIIRDCLAETPRFDVLAMGRGEGEGCYCYVNAVLAKILVDLIKNYNIVLMDMEAGLEHLSRRVDKCVNTMIVVVDPTLMSLKTAERIKTVAEEVKINPERKYIVGNRIPQSMYETLTKWAEKIGYEVAGIIPEDELIMKYNLIGKPLLTLPSNSVAVEAAKNIAKNIGLID